MFQLLIQYRESQNLSFQPLKNLKLLPSIILYYCLTISVQKYLYNKGKEFMINI
jgi:hypothetical protein